MAPKLVPWLKRVLIVPERHRELRHYMLFKDLNAHELQLVHNYLHRREYAAGETVFEEGFPVEALYLIESGELQITGIRDDHANRILKRHQFVGVIDLFAQSARLSTAAAHTELTVLAISQEDFWELLRQHPALGVKILSACGRFLAKYIVENNTHSEV